MFDIGAAELLVLIIVAVIVIGPKDMPLALRTVGKWVGKIRRVSSHFRTGLDAMVREAELEEMEKKWKAQNEAIMAKSSAETPPDPRLSQAPKAEARVEDPPEMTGPPPQTEAKKAKAKNAGAKKAKSASSKVSGKASAKDSGKAAKPKHDTPASSGPELPLSGSGAKPDKGG